MNKRGQQSDDVVTRTYDKPLSPEFVEQLKQGSENLTVRLTKVRRNEEYKVVESESEDIQVPLGIENIKPTQRGQGKFDFAGREGQSIPDSSIRQSAGVGERRQPQQMTLELKRLYVTDAKATSAFRVRPDGKFPQKVPYEGKDITILGADYDDKGVLHLKVQPDEAGNNPWRSAFLTFEP